MKKIISLFLFILTLTGVTAQDLERVNVRGTVVMPEGEDPQGISVFNISSRR